MIGRHRSAVVTIVAWAIGLAALYSFSRTAVYTSEAAVLVRPAVTAIGSSEGVVNPDTESQVVGSTTVARLAATEMDEHPPIERMLANLSVDVPENTEILRISYSSPDPITARQGANAFANAYLEFRRAQAETKVSELMSTLQGELDVLNPEIDDLRSRLTDPSLPDAEESQARNRLRDITSRRQTVENQLFVAQTKTIDPGEVIAPALAPDAPSSPNHLLDLALGAMVGLGLGFGLAYVRDRRDPGFRSAAELEGALGGLPVLGVIPPLREESPRRGDPIALYRSGGPISEAYRTLRAAILWRAAKSRLSTIAVTSARPGEGSTMTSAMLAIALASAGKRVVLIDADLRGDPSRHLGALDRPGLADVLTGRIGSVTEVLQETDVPNLSVATRGFAGTDADPAELLQPDRMLKVLEECADADFVVIDAPPVLAVADALVIAPLADGVLLVSAARGTSRQGIEFARIQLERTGANVLGGVLVGLHLPVGSDRSRSRRRIYPVSTSPQPGAGASGDAAPQGTAREAPEPLVAPRGTEVRGRSTRSDAPPRDGASDRPHRTDEPAATAVERTAQGTTGSQTSRVTDDVVPEPLEGSAPMAPSPASRKQEMPKRRAKANAASRRARMARTSGDEQADASGPAADRSPGSEALAEPSGDGLGDRERRKTPPRPDGRTDAVDPPTVMDPPRAPIEAPDSASAGPGSEPGVSADQPPATPGSSPESGPRSGSRSDRQGTSPERRRTRKKTTAADARATPAESTPTESTPTEGTPIESTPPVRAQPNARETGDDSVETPKPPREGPTEEPGA